MTGTEQVLSTSMNAFVVPGTWTVPAAANRKKGLLMVRTAGAVGVPGMAIAGAISIAPFRCPSSQPYVRIRGRRNLLYQRQDLFESWRAGLPEEFVDGSFSGDGKRAVVAQALHT